MSLHIELKSHACIKSMLQLVLTSQQAGHSIT